MKVEQFLRSKNKVFFVVTGCSLIFTEELQSYGGSSNTVLGIYQPYSEELFYELVPMGVNNKIVSEETAIKMCKYARIHFKLPDDCIVVSCTASLCKRENERKDRVNEVFICVNDNVTHKTLDKIPMSLLNNRHAQEWNVAGYILDSLFKYCEKKNELQKNS